MADDLFQDSCEKVLRSIDQWDPDTRLDSWVYRIVHNTFLDMVRSSSNRARLLDENLPPPDEAFDGQGAQESRLALSDLDAALAKIPVDQRTVLLLVTVEGYSYKDASEILNIPVGTLTSRLVRAREALKTLMNSPSLPKSGPRLVIEGTAP